VAHPARPRSLFIVGLGLLVVPLAHEYQTRLAMALLAGDLPDERLPTLAAVEDADRRRLG
jgi:hypothetical protein